MPDADESTWQDVLSKSSQEVGCGKSHDALLIAVRIISPPEGDPVTIKSKQAMIADGNPMRIAAQVAKHLRWSAERRLGINNPVFPK